MIAGITSLLEISSDLERIQKRKIVFKTFVSRRIEDPYKIGLAKVEYAFVFTKHVKPVAFPSTTVNFDFNKSYEMAFWGCEFVHNPTTRHFLPNPLEYTNVVFIPKINSKTEPLSQHSSIIYGETTDGRGFGIGSSGYGVIAKEKGLYVIYAVLTESVGCNREFFPSTFSRIGYFIQSIYDKMNVYH